MVVFIFWSRSDITQQGSAASFVARDVLLVKI